MIDNTTLVHVYNAIAAERRAAVDKNGHFHSNHEGWAVLKEEVEEVGLAHGNFANKANSKISFLWDRVKADDMQGHEDALEDIKNAAIDLAGECVQVAAMCDKWLEFLEGAEE